MFASPINKTLFVIALSFVFKLSLAQPGILDPTFGSSGLVITHAGNSHEFPSACTLQPDAKILIAGSTGNGYTYDAFIARYLEDGSIDSTFSIDGIYLYSSNASNACVKVLVTPEGKLRLLGNTAEVFEINNQIFLHGVNSDGTWDNSFNSTVLEFEEETHASSAAFTPDGRIVAGGYIGEWSNQGLILLFDANGNLDTSFNHTGYRIANGSNRIISLAMQDTNILVLVGSSDSEVDTVFTLNRVFPDGSYDLSFGINGVVTYNNDLNADEKLFVQTDNNFIVMITENADSYFQYNTHLIRFTEDGLVDNNFGLNGAVEIQEFTRGDVLIQQDGKIYLAGCSSPFAPAMLIRFQNDGTIDSSFGVNGVASFENVCSLGFSMCLDSLQRIILTSECGTWNGDSDIITVRILTELALQSNDFTSMASSPLVYPNPISGDAVVIRYDLPASGHVSIDLSSVDGKQIAQLLSQDQAAGNHRQSLRLPDQVSSGTYLVHIRSEWGTAAVKLMIER